MDYNLKMSPEKIIDFYHSLGGNLIPVKHKGKIPVVKKWNVIEISKEDLLKKYPAKKYNWAFVVPDNMFVVDVEKDKGGFEQLEILKKQFKIDVYKTFHVFTGGGGLHAYYKFSGKKNIFKGYLKKYKDLNEKLKDIDGIEIIQPGSRCTIPPSVHSSNKKYVFGKVKAIKKSIHAAPSSSKNVFWSSEETKPKKEKKEPVTRGIFDDLEYYLSYIPTEKFNDYEEWVKILFSVHDFCRGNEQGLSIFIDWCMKDPHYKNNKEHIRKQWLGIKKIKEKATDSQKLITKYTLFYYAHKFGAKIKANLNLLIDEILNKTFHFISTAENDGEYVRDLRGNKDVFINSEKKKIGEMYYTTLTNGAISLILDFIHNQCRIYKKEYTITKIQASLEKNRFSLFTNAWEAIEVNAKKQMKGLVRLKSGDNATNIKKLFFQYLEHRDVEIAKEVYPFFVKYLVSGVKSNLKEFDELYRTHSQTCLCIYSKDQGIGKSTLARVLTPMPDMIYYPSLKNIREPESKLAISRSSMCIIDDYQPSYQKELNNVNELITQHTILVRPKYGRIEIPKIRRAYFALTTNYKQIINDWTGSRRWVHLDLLSINIDKIIKIMPKVHAEMIALARSKYQSWLTIKEIKTLEVLNESITGNDTLDQILLNHYSYTEDTEENEWISLASMMKDINRAYGSNRIREANQLGLALRHLFPEVKDHVQRVQRQGKKLTIYPLKVIRSFTTNEKLNANQEITIHDSV